MIGILDVPLLSIKPFRKIFALIPGLHGKNMALWLGLLMITGLLWPVIELNLPNRWLTFLVKLTEDPNHTDQKIYVYVDFLI